MIIWRPQISITISEFARKVCDIQHSLFLFLPTYYCQLLDSVMGLKKTSCCLSQGHMTV